MTEQLPVVDLTELSGEALGREVNKLPRTTRLTLLIDLYPGAPRPLQPWTWAPKET